MALLDQYLKDRSQEIEQWLDRLLPATDLFPTEIHRAMRYSIFAGGKRLRPILVLAAGESFQAQLDALYVVAAAMEMIHTYSLIHDDLPAMDNDDLRRGVPTCHKVFGEALAILAGDALLTHAFQVMANIPTNALDSTRKVAVIAEIAMAAGSVKGMIGGQVVDILSEGKQVSADTLEYIHNAKTGALIRAAVRVGAIIGGASAAELESITRYGTAIGLAFQIIDDLLDIVATSEQLGKTAGKDLHSQKITYVSLYGMEYCKQHAKKLVDDAVTALQQLQHPHWALAAIAQFFVERTS